MADSSRRLDLGIALTGVAAAIVAVFQQSHGVKLGIGLLGGVLVVTAIALAMRISFHERRLRRRERRIISDYHVAVVSDFMQELPLPGPDEGAGLAAQIRAKSAYVPVPYCAYAASFSRPLPRRQLSQHPDDPVSLLLALVQSGESALILGAPGSGKTLVAALTFATLADKFRSSRAKGLIPILLRLSTIALSEGATSRGMSIADFVPKSLEEQLGRERLDRLMRAGRLRLVLDGLDELPSGTSTRLTTTPMPEELVFLLQGPTITTCREAFHTLYVDTDRIATSLGAEIEMLPLTYEGQAVPFVHRYCEALSTPSLAEPILEILNFNASMADTLSRPLMLRMIVDVLQYELANDNVHAAQRLLLTGSDFLNARIYQKYVMTWLNREQRKESRPTLDADQKLNLIELIAWQIFCNPGKTDAGYGSFELFDLTIARPDLAAVVDGWVRLESKPDARINAAGALEEVAERTFLIISERGNIYRFAHKSFFEYLVAHYVYNRLADRNTAEPDAVALLNRPFPDEVIDFLRELLHWSNTSEEEGSRRRAVVRAFVSVVREEAGRDSSLMARQQAANLLPIVATPEVQNYLTEVVASDDHPFIRRAIAVGEALHHQDSRYMDLFVESLDTDARARSFHMGYNRIYYGDQPLSSTDYEDDGRVECSRFFRACVRHLTLDRYRYIRSMAVATIGILLEDPARCAYLVEHELPGLQQAMEICRQPQPELGPVYERQRIALGNRLDQVLQQQKIADDSNALSLAARSEADGQATEAGADVLDGPGSAGDEGGRNTAQVDRSSLDVDDAGAGFAQN
jgi:hypothetical protein